MNVRNLDTDRLTILSRSFLQNNTLRAHTLSKALEPCAHSPAGSLCTRLTDIGILGSRYYYFLCTYIAGVTPAINGLVMLHYPELPMPEAAIKRHELIEMIMEYDNADEERAKKRAKASKL